MQPNLDLQFPPFQSNTHHKNFQIKGKGHDHPTSILSDRDFHYSHAESNLTEGSSDEEQRRLSYNLFEG